MKILGVDASTKTGWSLFHDGALITYGLVSTPNLLNPLQDLKYYAVAEHQAESVASLILEHDPDYIIIEQTNQGRSRDTQKQLEFIHCLILQVCQWLGVQDKIVYVDTSHWRSALGIKLSKEQRVHNKEVKKKTARGKVTPKHLSVDYVNKRFNKEFILKDNDITDAICLGCMAEPLQLNQGVFGGKVKDMESMFTEAFGNITPSISSSTPTPIYN